MNPLMGATLAGGGLQAGAGILGGILGSVFGSKDATKAKRRALNLATWTARRNMADANAWGTQAALDVRKDVAAENAKAAQFVHNQGLAGSTITPTLQAANTFRGNDALARIGQERLNQKIAIRNAQQGAAIPALMAPGTPNFWDQLPGLLSGAAHSAQGLGPLAMAAFAQQQPQATAQPMTAPQSSFFNYFQPAGAGQLGPSANGGGSYFDWLQPQATKSGFYGAKPVE